MNKRSSRTWEGAIHMALDCSVHTSPTYGSGRDRCAVEGGLDTGLNNGFLARPFKSCLLHSSISSLSLGERETDHRLDPGPAGGA